MKGVILAGGEGTRLRPLTLNRPKPLVPILDRPCLSYVLDSVVAAGVDELFITTSYRAQQVLDHVGTGERYGARVVYTYEDRPLGTAGGVKLTEPYHGDDTFVVASGDVLADVDLGALLDFHRSVGAVATMALTEVEEPTQYGIVGLDDDQRIERFLEKPSAEEVFSNLINAGIYIFEARVLDFVPSDDVFDFSRDLFPLLLDRGEGLFGCPIGSQNVWRDIGRPRDLYLGNMDMLKRRSDANHMIAEDAEVGSDVTFEGRCYVGSGAEIGEGALLKDSVVFAGAVVGPGVKLSDSLVLRASRISEGSELESSIIGEEAVVGPRARVSNCTTADGVQIADGSSVTDELLS